MSTGNGARRPEFQLEVSWYAERLDCGSRPEAFRGRTHRVREVLSLAFDVCTVLEPQGWQLRSVRFEDGVTVALVKYATAASVIQDLGLLPERILARFGETLHLCVTAGEHVYEVSLDNGHFAEVDVT